MNTQDFPLPSNNHFIDKFQYTQAMIHSIQNADGTVSIIQVDPNNQIITLPDGTTAQVQGVATVVLFKIRFLRRMKINLIAHSFIQHKMNKVTQCKRSKDSKMVTAKI